MGVLKSKDKCNLISLYRLIAFLNSSPNARESLLKELSQLTDDKLKWLLRNWKYLKNEKGLDLHPVRDEFVEGSNYFKYYWVKKWELAEYTKDLPFDTKQMINDWLVTKLRYDLEGLDDLLQIYKNNKLWREVKDLNIKEEKMSNSSYRL